MFKETALQVLGFLLSVIVLGYGCNAGCQEDLFRRRCDDACRPLDSRVVSDKCECFDWKKENMR